MALCHRETSQSTSPRSSGILISEEQEAKRWRAVCAVGRGAWSARVLRMQSDTPQVFPTRRRRLVFKCIDNPPPRRRRLLSHALLLLPRPPATLRPPPSHTTYKDQAGSGSPTPSRWHSSQIPRVPTPQVQAAGPKWAPAHNRCSVHFPRRGKQVPCASPHLPALSEVPGATLATREQSTGLRQSDASTSLCSPLVPTAASRPHAQRARWRGGRGHWDCTAVLQAHETPGGSTRLAARTRAPPHCSRGVEAGVSANRGPPVRPIAAGAAPRPAPGRKRVL